MLIRSDQIEVFHSVFSVYDERLSIVHFRWSSIRLYSRLYANWPVELGIWIFEAMWCLKKWRYFVLKIDKSESFIEIFKYWSACRLRFWVFGLASSFPFLSVNVVLVPLDPKRQLLLFRLWHHSAYGPNFFIIITD